MNLTYEQYKEAADFILDKIDFVPEVGIVLGTTLGEAANKIETVLKIDYKDIPNFPLTTAKDHAGILYLGYYGGKKVAVMSGRFHYYEGNDREVMAFAPRFFKLLGCSVQILSNATGSINYSYNSGDIMVIKDHIMLYDVSPLVGVNEPRFGPRHPDMSNAYDKDLREIAKKVGREMGIILHEGTYFYTVGPQFETPAEIKAARILGGDAVGMSTVAEVIAGAQCGIKTLAFSIISNPAAGMSDEPLSIDEINLTMERTEIKFSYLLEKVLKEI